MSILRLPALDCDGCHQPSRQHVGDSWMSAQDLRHEAARSHWVRSGRKDLCPHCAGYYEDRNCSVCGRSFWGSYAAICAICTGEALPDPPRTLEDAHWDELRAAGVLR